MLLLTRRGTPTVYYGDEIGMEDAAIPPHRERDPQGLREPGHSRDPQRTPMRWDGSPNGGFTTGEPWLPMGADVAERNVARQPILRPSSRSIASCAPFAGPSARCRSGRTARWVARGT